MFFVDGTAGGALHINMAPTRESRVHYLHAAISPLGDNEMKGTTEPSDWATEAPTPKFGTSWTSIRMIAQDYLYIAG